MFIVRAKTSRNITLNLNLIFGSMKLHKNPENVYGRNILARVFTLNDYSHSFIFDILFMLNNKIQKMKKVIVDN